MTPDHPFTPVYSRESFLETPGGGEALRRLDDGLGAREPFLLVTGGPGTGKTTLAYEAVARWGSRVTAAFIAYPALTVAEFLEEIIRRFGAEPPDGASRSKLVACVERALGEITSRGQVATLIVDDAHGLSPELLEVLRLLVNAAQQVRRPLEVMLIGLPTLEAKLNEPALVALRQRVSVHAKLEPLPAAETRRYLHHRVTAASGDGPGLFSRKTCRDIAARTGGVPRQINALAAEALRVARAWGDQTVGAEHVQTAAAALGLLVPTGNFDDSDDAGPEDSPAPITSPRAVAPAKVPVVAPTPAPVVAPAPAAVARPTPAPVVAPAPVAVVRPTSAPAVAPAPAPKPQPSPKAEAAVRAPAPSATPAGTSPAVKSASAARVEADATPAFTPPAKQDAREWVARFVGDKGPLQLSSQALAQSSWAAEPSDASDAGTQGAEETPPPPRRPQNRARPRTRSRRRGGLRFATTALLAAMVVVTAVVLVMRAGGLARGRAGRVARVMTTAAAPKVAHKASSTAQQVADKAPTTAPPNADNALSSTPPDADNASSSGVPRADSRIAGPSPLARVDENSLDGSTTRSNRAYTLDVGGYLDLESALEQRDRMHTLTGIEGWVVTAADDGGNTYRIVLGAYRSYERATAAADMLLNTKTLSDVTVVPLPSRRVRQ